MRARALLAPLALPVLLLAAACGEQASAGPNASDDAAAVADEPTVSDEEFEDLTGEAKVVIEARDNTFMGQYVTVSAGTEVTFDNRGRNPHNAVPVEPGAFEGIDTEALEPGNAATVVLDEPGEYPYYCTLHGTETAGMVGMIRVVE